MLEKKNIITFTDDFFMSTDEKTILGETNFKDIIFLDYRDSEAGSNPREYNGLKKANLEIIKSLLKDPKNMFRFLHSGIILSITGLKKVNSKEVSFESCCLTNGNQTRFIILILTILKIYSENNKIEEINNSNYKKYLKNFFIDKKNILEFLKYIKFTRISDIVKFLTGNSKYMDIFCNLYLEDFLNSKIRIQINIIENIIENVEDLDEYSAGTLIAQANNDTQNVKIDDIFGNRYKKELQQYVFKDFVNKYGDNINIEYRLGEIVDKAPKVHILTLLRPIISTGILTKESEIFKYSNQRTPVYNIFIKLLRQKGKAKKTISVIAKLIPFFYEIRTKYVSKYLKAIKINKDRELRERALDGELENTTLQGKIKINQGDLSEDSKKAIKKISNYNIEHIFPVLIYRLKTLTFFNENTKKIELIGEENSSDQILSTLIQSIYAKYVEKKLVGVTGSITDVIRSNEFFDSGKEAFITLRELLKFSETKYIKQNRFIISLK